MKALVGYTGFVGSNLTLSTRFDGMYNSKNVIDAYGTKPELLIYAGVPAEKYLANKAPEKDLAVIKQAEENIMRIAPKKLVLISTIDVFPDSVGVDETTVPTENNNSYGENRRELEIWTRNHYADALIVRLPALFGVNIKKNFIFDIINPIPFRLSDELFSKFSSKKPKLKEYYKSEGNGFFQLIEINREQKKIVREIFKQLDFSALNFTDSRSSYQFYPLARLWKDIETALKNDLRLFHTATESVTAGELYEKVMGKKFINELNKVPMKYDFRTCYGDLFGGCNGYIIKKDDVICAIGGFIRGYGDCCY